MSKNSSIKFKAELYKHFGFVLCSPLCGIIFNALVFKISLDDTMITKILISLALAAIGLSYIIKAIAMMEEPNASNNKLSGQIFIS